MFRGQTVDPLSYPTRQETSMVAAQKTAPTTVKINSIAIWIHASHFKPAPESSEQEDWHVEKADNPLKFPCAIQIND